jgi:hypothetical protein
VARRATTTVRRELPPSREKEKEMRIKFRIIGVSLASMAGLLLVSGVAWANPNQTPVSGIGAAFVITAPPEKNWLDDDGVRHIRNRRARLRLAGNIRGQMFRIASFNVDTVTREADFHGSFSFAGAVLGDRVSATGRFTALCSGEPSMCEEHQIWRLEDGRRINLTETFPLDIDGPDVYEGTLLDPPGHR